MKKSFLYSLIFILLIVVLPFMNAFGISMSYDENKPFIIAPGETKYIDFTILSSSKEKPAKLSLEILSNEKIASLTDKTSEYNLASGGEIKSKIKIKAPSEAINGTEYSVTLLIKDTTSSEETKIIGISYFSKINFKVLVNKPAFILNQEKIKLNFFVLIGLIILIFIILVIIAYIILKRRIFQ